MNRQQRGFTLIELVVVITLIGILAAVALPKFINIQNDARASVMKGVESSMQGADAMIYSKALIAGVEGKAAATNVSVLTNNGNVLTNFGYPTNAAINGLLDLQPATDFGTATAGTVTYKKAATPSQCAVTYNNAATASGGVPSITLVTSGC